MVRHYFIVAWRNLILHKLYFLINVMGLSVGMAACLLIVQYVNFELSFDHFNQNASHLYRIVNDRYQDGKLVQHSTMTYSAIGQALQNDYPEVINHTRVEPLQSRIVIAGEQRLGGQNGLAVDPSFFSMFSYPLTAGNKSLVLRQPNEIILSETCAHKLFGPGSDLSLLIGRIIQLEQAAYKITGICQDAPTNSHLQFDFLIAYASLYSGANKYWKDADYSFTESYFWHYIQLKPGSDYKKLDAKLDKFSQRYFKGTKVTGSIEKFYLQPLLQAHLYSDFASEIGKTGNSTIVWGALTSALLILIIAWVNYINLTTARSAGRAKEVGVRKSSGATKKQLVFQFFSESLLANSISLMMAAFLVYIFQDSFNQLIQQELSVAYLLYEGLYGKTVPLILLLVSLSGILIAGVYPALVLSYFKPALVLKGNFDTSFKGVLLRKALVVGQFAVTIALVIGSIVIYQQIQYTAKKKLGLTLSQVLIISPPQLSSSDSGFITKERSFKEDLKKLPHVKAATNSSRIPGQDLHKMYDVYRPDNRSSARFVINNMSVAEEFIDLYEIKLQAGRNFRHTDYSYDLSKARSVILNGSAIKLLGFTSAGEAIGKSVILYEGPYEIIGIVRDFHQKSLHHPVEPTVFMPNYSAHNPISVKVDSEDLTTTLAAIHKTYDGFFPGNVFDYHFLDETFNQQYNKEHLFGRVFAIFAVLAMLIASLGLLGLSWVATLRRTKEIGVRKILGASVQSIVVLLSTDFLILIMIAFAIASPVALYIMNLWLATFAYKIPIEWWMLVGSGLLAAGLALLTVSFQTVKAAFMNPIKSLKSE